MRKAIEIRVARRRPWRWALGLVEQLMADGHRVQVRFVDGQSDLPTALATLIALESLLYGLRGPRQTDMVPIPKWPRTENLERPDIVIDLGGRSEEAGASAAEPLWLAPSYENDGSEDALFAALVSGEAPHVAIAGRNRQLRSEGLIAIDDFTVIARAADQAFCRVQSLIRMAIQDGPARLLSEEAPPRPPARTYAGFATRQLLNKVRDRLTRLAGRPHHWRIAYRKAASADTIWERQAFPDEAYTTVPDDGRRYFADPFPFEYNGAVHVFCEEYGYATCKGTISVVALDSAGRPGPAVPIIEADYHLSYPFVFAAEDRIWMIPESSANETIELWRCEEYPHRWVRHAVLVDGVPANDATIIPVEGRLFMFASSRHGGSAGHDGLGIWTAEKLEGPWTAFSEEPILVDARASRPAGRMRLRDGRIWRVAQDCSAVYGGGLTLCEVDTLDPASGAFHQTARARVTAPPHLPWTGVHTLNEAGGYEFIDLCGRSAG